MGFIVIGTNHKYSPLELRERISFSKGSRGLALSILNEMESLKGAFILSTCNRVEIYASTQEMEEATVGIEGFISRYHEIDRKRILPYLYRYRDREALKHLVSVASGLDSLILGETQIAGQVKASFLEARQAGVVDGFLDRIFNYAVLFTRTMREETRMYEGKVSAGSVAVDFIKEKMGCLVDKNILIIGTGKVTELVLKHLESEGLRVVFVSNRTFDRAKELASRIGGEAVRFNELGRYLMKTDIVITATRSPRFIIEKKLMEETAGQRRSRNRLLILDLALPRDVDPRVKEIDGVELFGLEELNTVIQKNIEKRSREAAKIKKVIDIEVERKWSELIESERERVLLR